MECVRIERIEMCFSFLFFFSSVYWIVTVYADVNMEATENNNSNNKK